MMDTNILIYVRIIGIKGRKLQVSNFMGTKTSEALFCTWTKNHDLGLDNRQDSRDL